MSKSLIAFASDQMFLAPLMVPCLQIVDQGLTELADVVVYLVDVEPDIQRCLEDYFARRGIRFEPLESSALARAAGLNPTHRLPVAALARLVIGDSISSRHENIIYMDCDIQIVGDIRPLLTHQVPEGMIMAARSYLWLVGPGEQERQTGEYLANLGGHVSRDEYFNSGVIAFRRETWRELAPKALDFFVNHPLACRSMDQSALNAVCAGRVVPMSPAYNFINSYANASIQKFYRPKLLHFSGAEKPWNCTGHPWYGCFLADYARIFNLFPFLRGQLNITPPQNAAERLEARLRRHWATLRHPRSGIRRELRKRERAREARRKFFKYVKNANFPF